MWKVQRRRANAASARPPRTPRAYGFTAPRSFSSFLRPLVPTVAHLRERPSSTHRADDSRVDGAKCAREFDTGSGLRAVVPDAAALDGFRDRRVRVDRPAEGAEADTRLNRHRELRDGLARVPVRKSSSESSGHRADVSSMAPTRNFRTVARSEQIVAPRISSVPFVQWILTKPPSSAAPSQMARSLCVSCTVYVSDSKPLAAMSRS